MDAVDRVVAVSEIVSMSNMSYTVPLLPFRTPVSELTKGVIEKETVNSISYFSSVTRT